MLKKINCMLRNYLPQFIKKRLWGNRKTYQNNFDSLDPDWIEWKKFSEIFYLTTQQSGIGLIINSWGYKIVSKINLDNKSVLELGGALLPHRKHWNGRPAEYHIVDLEEKYLQYSENILLEENIKINKHLLEGRKIPEIKNDSIDVIFTFYSLEHLVNLENDLKFYFSKLKEGGCLVGAIPNEGGLAWGIGRFLTSRRFVHKNSNINYDKIICWEHPNYCDDILNTIEKVGFSINTINVYPFGKFCPKDVNLVTSFIFTK